MYKLFGKQKGVSGLVARNPTVAEVSGRRDNWLTWMSTTNWKYCLFHKPLSRQTRHHKWYIITNILVDDENSVRIRRRRSWSRQWVHSCVLDDGVTSLSICHGNRKWQRPSTRLSSGRLRVQRTLLQAPSSWKSVGTRRTDWLLWPIVWATEWKRYCMSYVRPSPGTRPSIWSQ